jgi:AraC-like DNA-binding protein
MNRIDVRAETFVDGDAWKRLAFAAHFKAESLARLCGVSLRTLQRYFSRHESVTVSEWLQKVRLSEAYGRLKGGARVKEVAYDLGYKQLSQFSRDFKKHYGIPPSFLNESRLSLGERMNKVNEPDDRSEEADLADRLMHSAW